MKFILIFLFPLGSHFHDPADPTVCSKLNTFVTTFESSSIRTTGAIFSWAFPGKEPNVNLTRLDVTNCPSSVVFPLLPKFPALRQLNLAGMKLARQALRPRNSNTLQTETFHQFQNLEWLELKGSRNFTERELFVLLDKVGKTLHYLGLGGVRQITDSCLINLAYMFPVLRTLDLSDCNKITDAILVEWYFKHDKSEWPRLRKLVLKGCKKINQKMVQSVRLKTRNQLLIDF